MKATSEHTLQEAANNLPRLDENYWSKIVVSGADGLEVLPSQGPLALEEQANTERVRQVFESTRSMYKWIVLDLGRLNPFSASLVPDLCELFLTAIVEVPALYELKRMVSRLLDAGVDRSRLRLILNPNSETP